MARNGVLRTKDVDTVLEQNKDKDSGHHHARLSKRLTAWDLMGFGIGIVIGTGIFTFTGVEAKNHAGPAIVISFAIAGVVSLLAALCYAEVAAAVPTAGSSYTYAYTTIGEIFAWIIAWDLILEFALGAAVVARGWSGYLQESFGLPSQWFGEENSVVNLGAAASKPSRISVRRPRTPPRTCRADSSARWSSAPCSTSRCASSSPAW